MIKVILFNEVIKVLFASYKLDKKDNFRFFTAESVVQFINTSNRTKRRRKKVPIFFSFLTKPLKLPWGRLLDIMGPYTENFFYTEIYV